jgi:hypothetical protein
MFVVEWIDHAGAECQREFDNLIPALEWAKTLAYFVTITGGEDVIVGKFGVDAVVAGQLPGGADYTWRKRR